MKLLIIFSKDIEISPEKICVHTGHSARHIASMLLTNNPLGSVPYNKWQDNDFKTVLLRDNLKQKGFDDLYSFYYRYNIVDAGLDGVYPRGTVLGYAVLVPKDDESFKRLRTLKF